MIDIIFLTGSMGGAMIYFSTFHMKDDNSRSYDNQYT